MACFSAESPDSPLTTTSSMNGPGQNEVDNEAGQSNNVIPSLLKVLKSPVPARERVVCIPSVHLKV